MSLYARVSNGIVAETFSTPSGFAITDCFHATLDWVACPAGTASGYAYNGSTFTAPAVQQVQAPTIAQQAAAALNGGLQIVSTSTPALNGVYPIDPQTQADIMAEMVCLLVNSAFTNGTTTIGLPDVAGALHSFSVPEFKLWATAIGTYVAALKTAVTTNSGTLPTQPVTIA